MSEKSIQTLEEVSLEDWKVDNLRRRLGEFIVSDEIIDDYGWGPLWQLLRNLIIVNCSHEYENAGFRYIAICPKFEIVPACHMAPMYFLVFNQNGEEVSFSLDTQPLEGRIIIGGYHIE